jgi:Flp pilus assembly pilin Flp
MNRRRQQAGQGLVEYAAILVLVGIVVIGVLVLLGPNIGNVFSDIVSSLDRPTAVAGAATETSTPGPSPTDGSPPGPSETPSATDTPPPTDTNPPPPPPDTDTPEPTETETASPADTDTPVPSATPSPTSTRTPTATPTPTFTPTPQVIFADGFESGDTSAWSSSNTDGGDLSVSAAAALVGSRGMQIVVNDNNSVYVQDDSPDDAARYRARFYFDPNSISMSNGNAHFIFVGYTGAATEVLRVEFRRSANSYQLRAALRNDGSGWTNSSWFTISDDAHLIEVDWRASSGPGANSGGLTFWIDEVERADLTGIDNDTRRIELVRLGAVSGVDSGTRGTYYFDAFESRTDSYIGPA